MPFVGGGCQLRTVFPDCPRCTLVKADGESDIQVRVIGGIKLCHIIVCYGIGDFSLCHLGDEVFCTDTVVGHFMDVDTSSELFVQIDQPFIIFSGLHIYIFPDEFRYVFQWFGASAVTLHDDLVRDDLFAAIKQAVFPFLGDGKVVGYEVSLACQQLLYEFVHIPGYLYSQLHSQALGKLFAQLILESHVLATVDEVGSGTVQCQYDQFSAVLYLLQVIRFFFFGRMSSTASCDAAQQQQQDNWDGRIDNG